jgi:hypothetical protein
MVVVGYILPGLSKVFIVTTLTSVSTPSAAEVNAGVEISPAVRGIPDAPRSGNQADDSDISTRVNKQVRGTIDLGALTVQLKRTLATETEYNAVVEGDSRFLVVLRQGTAGASPAAGDMADVFTIEVNTKGPGTPGRDEVDFSNVEMVNRAEPEYDAVLAA